MTRYKRYKLITYFITIVAILLSVYGWTLNSKDLTKSDEETLLILTGVSSGLAVARLVRIKFDESLKYSN